MSRPKMGAYTALCCMCGNRRPLKIDGSIGEHRHRPDDCEGGLSIANTEQCKVCKVHVGQGFAHKMDCYNPKRTPTGRDTR